MIEFLGHLGLLSSIILGLTAFKVIACKPFKEDGEDFSAKKLIVGLSGNLLIALAICGVYAAGIYWGAEMVVVTIGETECTVCAALDLMLLTAIAVYSKKLIVNFAELLGITNNVKESKEVLPAGVVGPQNDEVAVG